jgi:hypothetical protein
MTQTYNVSSKQLLSNYAVLQTLEPNGFVVGQSITVDDVGGDFDGNFTILATPGYLFIGVNATTGFLQYNLGVPLENQVLYACEGDDVQRVQSFEGTIVYSTTCEWIAWDDIATYLGIPVATEDDETFLVSCAAAANAYAFRKRSQSGYVDSLANSPSGDVTLATRMIGAAYYRQRGSMDSFNSYDSMSTVPTPGITPMILQLLGVNRPQIA